MGDEIFILEGAEYPFKLRETNVEGQYTVVGKVCMSEENDSWDPSKLRNDVRARDLVLV